MNQMQKYKTWAGAAVLGCLLLVQTSLVAAQDITGQWEMAMEFGGRPSYGTLTISKNADGTLAGKWGSNDLSNVKLQDGKLSFVRTVRFGDQEFSMNYNGTLKDGKLTGTMSSDRGEFAANGARLKPMPPAVGVWDLTYKIGDRDITARLTVSQKPDGALDAKWASQMGESVISNVKLQDGKLTFDRAAKFNDQQFTMTFTGTAQGDKLTGVSKNEQLEVPVTGQRFGAALIGQWELTSTSERGTRTSMLTIRNDLSGRYESFGGEIPVKDLTLEGNQVTFAIEMGFGDQAFKLDFKGTLDGNALKGQMTSERGTSEVTGKKLAAAAAPAVAGTRELTSQSIFSFWQQTDDSELGFLGFEPKSYEVIAISKDNKIHGYMGRLDMMMFDCIVSRDVITIKDRNLTLSYRISGDILTMRTPQGKTMKYRRLAGTDRKKFIDSLKPDYSVDD